MLGACLIGSSWAAAQEAPAGQEIRELRQVIEQQSKRIDVLTEQVNRLAKMLEGQKTPAVPEFATRAEKEAAAAGAAAGVEAPKAEPIPKAEAVPAGPRHVVSKGETLTSIAKQYNIPIAELKNANKIEDERKLQIGQVLTVPAPKSPEIPDKKENP
jgi:LysM repeat protein